MLLSTRHPRDAVRQPRRILASSRTFTLDGISARPVRVEVDIRRGLPAFCVVGLPDAAVREASGSARR
jgi:magnesium chelatase family protein